MRKLTLFALAAFGLYLATGFYIVRGNERAVIRRCGKFVVLGDGKVRTIESGLHFDLPWPFLRVDRVNLHEVRTMEIGISQSDLTSGEGFLAESASSTTSGFLTGDKNILDIKLNVQYRVLESAIPAYLHHSTSVEKRLHAIGGAALTELTAMSGVDFVHTIGRSAIQTRLTEVIRARVNAASLGIEIDSVAMESVHPPLRAKAAFLDVINARAEKEQTIHSAEAYAVQRREAGDATAQRTRDEAEAAKRGEVESARATADNFRRRLEELQRNASRGIPYEAARRMTLRRAWLDTVDEVLRRSSVKVLLDSGKQVDLTILRGLPSSGAKEPTGR